MRFRELKKLFEMSDDALKSLKSVIASKIKELPIDDVTIKTLREIEDLLRDVNAGGRKGLIDKDLKSIEDPAVHAAQKMLSRYILSIDSTPEQRNELFNLWKNDKIVNKENLFSGKSSSFADIFNGYSTNSLIQELVNDLMNVATLGHGKGEFALNVLSKDIYKPSDGKGDLKVRWNNKDLQVEVKTSSETITIDPESGKEKKSTSSARFGDQEVRPAAGWDPVARELNDFVRGSGSYKSRKGFKQAVPTSGLSLKSAILVHQSIDNKDKSKFMELTKKVLTLIFGDVAGGRKDYLTRLKKNTAGVINAIEVGDLEGAKQYYSLASFNYYMAKKEDDGVLFIDLPNKSVVWYNSAEALSDQGMRLHADSIYLTGVKDPGRTAYPQIYVQPTTYGGQAAQTGLGKIAKGKNPLAAPDFNQKMIDWAMQLAARRGVSNQRIISGMAINAMKMIQQKMPSDQIIASLEQMYPQIAPKVKPQAAPAPAPAVAPAPAPAPAAPVSTPATMRQPAV
jgi:hypothetical protein